MQHRVTEVAFVELDAAGTVVAEASWGESDGDSHLGLVVEGLTARLRAGAVLVAHNLRFDLAFLEADPRTAPAAAELSRWLCTLNVGGRASLSRAAAVEGAAIEAAHTALGDARTLARILAVWIGRAVALDHSTVAGLVLVARRRWATGTRAEPLQEAGWSAVREALPLRAPVAPLTRAARRAFGTVVAELGEAGPTTPGAIGEAVDVVRGAGVCRIQFDRLASEARLTVGAAFADAVPD